VSFGFEVLERGVALTWVVPEEAGMRFEVKRAEQVGDGVGSYAWVAQGVEAGMDGTVRVVDAGAEEGWRYVYRLEGEGGWWHETAGVKVPVRRAQLGQNYPNPFNPVTRIEYKLPGNRTRVSVVVYDVSGRKVRTLVNGEKDAGRHVVDWDGRDEGGRPVGSGVYFYRMVAAGFSDVRKMVLLK
jgi:hypothetical protein